MPTDEKWQRYIARHKDGNLIFCENIQSNEFKVCYALFDAQFKAMSMPIADRSENE